MMVDYINRKRVQSKKRLGVRAPIRNASTDGVFDLTETTLDKVKSQLYVLLFTEPGSRVMIPTFGSPLFGLQFEQVTEADIPQITTSVRDAVEKWVTEAQINDISVELNENQITLNIRFALKSNPNLEDWVIITAR